MSFNQIPDEKIVDVTSQALQALGYHAEIVSTKAVALAKIQEIIPAQASVMAGASVTLEQIGFVDYLQDNKHDWRDLKAEINAEDDAVKRHELRRQSVLADYYLGSVHALTTAGEYVVASNTGSQLAHVVFTSPNLIFVVSTKKITTNLQAALDRLNQHVMPLEDQHMQDLYQINTAQNKLLVVKGENPMLGRKIHFILVNEDLGF